MENKKYKPDPPLIFDVGEKRVAIISPFFDGRIASYRRSLHSSEVLALIEQVYEYGFIHGIEEQNKRIRREIGIRE